MKGWKLCTGPCGRTRPTRTFTVSLVKCDERTSPDRPGFVRFKPAQRGGAYRGPSPVPPLKTQLNEMFPTRVAALRPKRIKPAPRTVPLVRDVDVKAHPPSDLDTAIELRAFVAPRAVEQFWFDRARRFLLRFPEAA